MIAEAVVCLAMAMYHEAKGEPREGILAVAHVVVNRTNNPAFPSTVCEVVYQGKPKSRFCQFSWTCDGRSDAPTNREKYYKMLAMATSVLEGETKDPTRGAMFFHNRTVKPTWSFTKVKTREIAQHSFYR